MQSSIPEIHSGLHLIRALFWEFVGTAAIVYSFNFSANDFWIRGLTYFTMWVLAFTISGAHFNPAITLGVYLSEGKYGKQIGRLILYWLFQLMGAFAGILMTYLIFNEPIQGYLLWPNENIGFGVGATRYFSEFGNIYYAKILWLEMLNTFSLVLCYLLIVYRPALRTVDEIIKGLGIALVFYACLATTAESGGCLNPALAIAQVSYQVGFLNGFDLNGGRYASPIWCYIVFPLVGAILAALLFRLHIAMDNRALKKQEPQPVQPVVERNMAVPINEVIVNEVVVQ